MLSKDEIVDDLTKHYQQMKKIADDKYEKATSAENDGSCDLKINSRTKKENVDLKEYNNQVMALCRVARELLNVTKSNLPKDEEEAEEDNDNEELV